MKFDLKNGKTYFESLISLPFDVLHCSRIVHMNHTEHTFQYLPVDCTNKVPKNHNYFFHFCHGGGTHLLVLAQTLIYLKKLFVKNNSPSVFIQDCLRRYVSTNLK